MRGRSVMLVGFVALFACGSRSAHHAPRAVATRVAPQPTPVECSTSGAPCERFGIRGTCLASRCVLRGACSYDIDCDDANPCTVDSCASGSCRTSTHDGDVCTADDVPGTCMAGACLPAPPTTCGSDGDCADAAGMCSTPSCVDTQCRYVVAADGATCTNASGAGGTCASGRCAVTLDEAVPEQRCEVIRTAFGPYRNCEREQLRYRMMAAEEEEQEALLERRIRTEVLYDVAVSILPLDDGGYNVLVFNTRDRSDVRGLVDPSFVAFTVAQFTANSRWKSRVLQIWVTPYGEGWQLSTQSGRRALRRGRAASGLGFLGVVNIQAYRDWLQRSFRPIDAPAGRPRDVRTTSAR